MPSPEGRITKVMRTATLFLFHFTIFVLWWAQVDGQSLAHTVQGNPKEEMKHFAERGRKDLSGTVLVLVLYSTILVHGLSLTSAFFLFLQWSLGRLPLKKSACVVQGMTLSTVTYRNSSAELTRGKEARQIWERRIDCLSWPNTDTYAQTAFHRIYRYLSDCQGRKKLMEGVKKRRIKKGLIS